MRRLLKILAVFFIGGFCLIISCTYKKGEIPIVSNTPVDSCVTNIGYQKHIKPIMTTYCIFSGCHDAGAAGAFGNYEDYSEILSRKDIIKDRINLADGATGKMPQTGTIGPAVLTSCDLSKLNTWLNAGAPNN